MLLHDTSHATILRIHALAYCILFRYARCTARGREARDVGAEPEDGVWWTYPRDGRTHRVHA